MKLTDSERSTLLALAAASIAHGLEHGRPLVPRDPSYPSALRLERASFVTLNTHGRLRGCIGALEARRPLAEDVAVHAFAAAFQDPRFPPLGHPELQALHIHISVLNPRERLEARSEAEAISALRPGIDGLILEEGGLRSTFLPAVWDSLPDPGEFLSRLRLKAGLPAQYWSETLTLFRYTVEEFDARDPRL